MGSRKAAETHQRHGHRDLRHLGELPDFIGGIAKHRAAADVDDRLLRLHDRFSRLLNLILVTANRRIIAAQIYFVGIFKFRLFRADIFGNIDQHRTGPSARSNVKCFLHRLGQIIHVFHQHIVLRTRTADADIIRFLKRIVANQIGRHLPVKATNGTESMYASAKPVTILVMPGPRSPVQPPPCQSPWRSPSPCAQRPAHGESIPTQIFSLAQHIENLQYNAAGQAKDGFHTFAA